MNSLLSLRWFDVDDMDIYQRYASTFFEFTGDPRQDAMRWYLQLNGMVERFAGLRFKVEDPRPGLTAIVRRIDPTKLDRLDLALATVNSKANAKSAAKRARAKQFGAAIQVTAEDVIGSRHGEALVAMARRYGYDLGTATV